MGKKGLKTEWKENVTKKNCIGSSKADKTIKNESLQASELFRRPLYEHFNISPREVERKQIVSETLSCVFTRLCVSPKNILFHATVPLKSSNAKPNTRVEIREKMCVLSCKAQNHFEE